MKIEKLNDNQIRCTLTRADLAIREIKISELAYGSEKAKSLFRDMMKQAASEFGFNTEDIPLMIEAIPAPSGSVVLIVTKVDDPDELDERFSNFSSNNVPHKADSILEKLDGAEDLIDLLTSIKDSIKDDEMPDPEEIRETQEMKEAKVAEPTLRIRLFAFAHLDSVIHAANLLDNIYNGVNTLYKDEFNEIYVLALSQTDHTTSEFNRICNMMSEYGSLEKSSGIALAYLEEHCKIVINSDAIQQLNKL